ncbi:hypothetical protein [Phaffia rhodozyma]|uniref:DUF2470 domain-containing protein n=1 Tax=Phaffia rhodozyma TaxID=264483 RepID=A0A0F7SNI6_PHARH|nr:hypothetical protein [Phaffia rhodozyma]
MDQIIPELNGRLDTLTAFLINIAGVKDRVTDLRVSDLDNSGLELSYQPLTAEPGAQPKLAQIPFNPPVKTADEARTRLSKLREESFRALGVVPGSSLAPFERPPVLSEWGLVLALLGTQAMFLTATPTSFLPVMQEISRIRDTKLPGGISFVKWSYALLFVAHSLEIVWFTGSFLRKKNLVRREDLTKWSWWTLFFGLATTWPHYKREVQRTHVETMYSKRS